MLSITPIGSCRINTPLRMAEQSYKFARNLERIYGFTHSSAEAVQQVKFLLGDYLPSAAAEPLISPGKPVAELALSRHALSDLYIVELSSAKQFKLGTECVQLNYLTRHFKALFADKKIASDFWNLAGRNAQGDIDIFLKPFVDAGTIGQSEFEIIRELRCSLVTKEALDRDVRYLMDTLPNVFFVTHVNAVKQDGLPISSRSNFINLVRDVVKAAGGQVYDPTSLMQKAGQEFAIEDNSSSLAHFTPNFSKMLFDDWYRFYIQRFIDDLVDTPESPRNLQLVINDLQARYDMGAITELVPRIKAAISAFGPVPPLVGLQAQCYSALAEPAKAKSALESSLAKTPEDPDLITLLIEWCLANNAPAQGLEFFERLSHLGRALPLAKSVELARMLGASGELAKAHSLAADILERAPDDDQALAIYADLSLQMDDETGIQLCKNLVLKQPRDIDAVLALKLLMACHESDAGLKDYLLEAFARSMTVFAPAVTYLAKHGKDDLIADVVGEFCQNRSEILRHPLIKELVLSWGNELGSNISTSQKFGVLNRIGKVGKLNGEMRLVSRQLRSGLVANVREAVKQDDVDSVMILHKDASIALPPIPDSAIFLARHSYKNEAYAKALEFARGVVENRPDHTASWLVVMRSALKLKDYLCAEKAAQRLIELAENGKCHNIQEAEKRLARLPALCLMASRNATDVFEAWQLCMISARDAALADRVERQFDRLKREMGMQLRELHASESPAYLDYVNRVLALIPDFGLALQSLGRFYVSQRQFGDALPYWERLVALDPDDGQAKFQLDRCRDRLSMRRTA